MTTRAGDRPSFSSALPLAQARRPSPFGIVDELNCYFDSSAEPNNVHLEAWLAGHLDAERLREAVTAMLAGQPRARARRAAGGWWQHGYAWEFPPQADVDPVSATTWHSEAELNSARASFLAAAPALDHSPPFRLLLASGPGRDSLILNAHHAAFDGRSCLRLLRLIADHYRDPEPAEPQKPQELQEPQTSARVGLPRPRAEHANPPTPTPPTPPTPHRYRPAVRRTARIAPQRAEPRAPGYGFVLLELPALPALPAVASAPARPAVPVRPAVASAAARPATGPHVTVNDVLIAALIQAVVRWNRTRYERPAQVRITMPVDARLPGHADDLGNFSRLCSVIAEPAGAPDLTTVVAAQTLRAKQQPGPQVGPALAAVARAPVPTQVKRRLLRLAVRCAGRLECDTSLLSNLGNLADPPRFGRLSPAAMWFSTSAHMPRGLSVGAIGVDGRLHLCFRYRHALLDDAAARDFAAEYAAALATVTGMGG